MTADVTNADNTLLVTGGTGFVMSVLARAWLEQNAARRVIILDRSGLDAQATRHFEPVRDRLTIIEGDIAAAQQWLPALEREAIGHVVHGATVTPISRGSAQEDASTPPESIDPAAVLDINFMGTVRLLEWARRHPSLKRFVYVSSGSVYRHHGPDWSGEPLPEDGYVAPLTLYGISKFAAEMVANRYADLFGMSAISVRLASVYGPMDRATGSRDFRHVPNRVAHMALAGKVIRPNSLEPVGDYIQSTDAARAILALLAAPALHYRHYNIASGTTHTIGDIVGWARDRVPDLRVEVAGEAGANIVQDAALKTGMWGAYDIARIQRDTDWRPMNPKTAFLAYMDWIAADEISEKGRG